MNNSSEEKLKDLVDDDYCIVALRRLTKKIDIWREKEFLLYLYELKEKYSLKEIYEIVNDKKIV